MTQGYVLCMLLTVKLKDKETKNILTNVSARISTFFGGKVVILDLEILPLIGLTTTHFKAGIQQLLFLYMFILHLWRHGAEAGGEKDSSHGCAREKCQGTSALWEPKSRTPGPILGLPCIKNDGREYLQCYLVHGIFWEPGAKMLCLPFSQTQMYRGLGF